MANLDSKTEFNRNQQEFVKSEVEFLDIQISRNRTRELKLARLDKKTVYKNGLPLLKVKVGFKLSFSVVQL